MNGFYFFEYYIVKNAIMVGKIMQGENDLWISYQSLLF